MKKMAWLGLALAAGLVGCGLIERDSNGNPAAPGAGASAGLASDDGAAAPSSNSAAGGGLGVDPADPTDGGAGVGSESLAGSGGQGYGGEQADCVEEEVEAGADGESATGAGKSCPWFELSSGAALALDMDGSTRVGSNWIWHEGVVEVVPADTVWDDVSADGSMAVGNGGGEGWWWSEKCGARPLSAVFGELPEGVTEFRVSAMNATGTTIAGEMSYATHENDAFVWRRGQEIEWLADVYGFSFGTWDTSIVDVSADGLALLGATVDVSNPPPHHASGFVLREAGPAFMGAPEEFGAFTPTAISADGSVVVGSAVKSDIEGSESQSPAVWAEAKFLAPEYGTEYEGRFTDVSADGSIAVGWVTSEGSSRAILWDEDNGVRFADQVLVEALPAGIELTELTAISGDGAIVAGRARDAATFESSGFVACLP
jgi:hypothetical protein